ncbi:MAG: electron transfer flavoprotein subunit beta/FixA family protein [Oscillospiraceae bacterium]|jgi:electron transfer flavoprotein beta subunit|nr:electron transfer flavoprotein subunit beta/FixA family protein [Oscillospiraceae bacterium]
MRIVVCIKQVPATDDAKIDPVTKRIVREGMKAVLNPFDLYAVEEGVRLKEEFGGTVVAVTMGPPSAEKALRECLSLGCDEAYLLSDRAYGGSDTWATSYALAKGIAKIGDADLVICGKQAVDGDTAQVGPGIAAHLDWQQCTYVSKVLSFDCNELVAERMNEAGSDRVALTLPAVLTVVKDINQPRVPSLRSVLASLEAEIPVWKPADIGADVDKIGLNPSPTRVVKTAPPPPRSGETLHISGDAAQAAAALAAKLTQLGFTEGK